MKKRIVYLVIACLVCAGQSVYGQMKPEGNYEHYDGTTYYMLWQPNSFELLTVSGNKTFEDFRGKGAELYYDVYTSARVRNELTITWGQNGKLKHTFDLPDRNQWYKNQKVSLNDLTANPIKIACGTGTKKFENVKVTMAKYLEFPDGSDIAELTLDTKELGVESSGTFTFNWCNVSDVQVKVTKNAENFRFDALTTPYSQAGAWGHTKLTVYCTHQTADENVGEIQISSASLGKTITLTLKSSTDRHPTSHTWNITDKVSLGTTIDNVITISPAALQNSLILESSDNSVLSVNGNSVTALKAGTTTLRAYVPQTDTQAAVDVTMSITVDNKQNQTITWEQNLGTKPIGTEPITLTATTNSGLSLTYTSSDPNVASIDGNVLTIHKTGRANITVSQTGNEDYFPAELTKTIVIYDPSVACEDFFLAGGAFNLNQDLVGGGTGQKPFTWDASKPAGELVFDVIGEIAWPYSDEDITISIDVYRNGSDSKENDWRTITVSTKETGHHTITLDEDISGVNFRLDYKGGRNRTVKFTNVAIYQKRYIRPSESPIAFDAIQLGASATKILTLKYSALQSLSGTSMKTNDGIFTVENVTFWEDCGYVGTVDVEVTFSAANVTAADADKVFENTILIKNAQNETILEIPVSGSLLQGKWLPVIPQQEAAVGTPQYNMYQYLMYAHVNDDLKASVGLAANNIALDYSTELHVTNQMYYLMQVRAADDWHTFVAPFDITNAYVLELTPEPADNRAESARADMIARQNEANRLFYHHLLNTLPSAEGDLISSIKTYLSGLAGYATEQVGIWPIEQSYELHEGAEHWETTTDANGEVLFTKNWTKVTPTNMKKGRTYAMRFPWCEYCTNREPWDYWTGKLILFVGEGAQAISGSNAHSDITNTVPAAGEAHLTGNYTLADMMVNDAFVHDVTSDMYVHKEEAVVAPGTSVIYANIPAPMGMRARAIRRSGEIQWERDDANVTTAVRNTHASGLQVFAEQGGFSLLVAETSDVAVYSISGILVYSGKLQGGERMHITADAGVYVVHDSDSVQKVLVQ